MRMFEMKENLKIRKAKLKDVDRIYYLQSLLMKYHIKFDDFWRGNKDRRKNFCKHVRSTIRSSNGLVLVAEYNGKIVGYSLAKIKKRPPIFKIQKIGHIHDAFVMKQYRKRGIGRRLVNESLKWFKSKGMNYVEADVDVRNKLGLNAWKKFKLKPYLLRLKRKI